MKLNDYFAGFGCGGAYWLRSKKLYAQTLQRATAKDGDGVLSRSR
jgi:hypothetical protein